MRNYRIKATTKPWITQDIVKLLKDRDRLHKQAVITKSKYTYDQYRKLRNFVTQHIRNAKKKYFKDRIIGNKNSHQMWKSVQMILGDNKTCSVPLDISCDEINHYFTNIGTCTNLNEFSETDRFHWRGPGSIHEFKFREITDNEVFKFISQFPDKSNSDIVGLDARLLKQAAHLICKPLSFMFNASVSLGVVLTDWKTARVCPVFKGKGSKTDISNYRPISVLSHIAKVFEKCVQCQLLSYLEQHSFISIQQSAYIRHHSTQTLLHKVVDNWLESIDNELISGVCFFDVAKCYDSISHEVLLFKLEKYGIRGIEHNWFKSYLIGRKQASLCNNILSSFGDLKSGVPQGSILGPVLFLLFMSDLPIGLSEIYKYADDTMINRHAELVTDVNYTLQHDIDKVCHWFELNRLSLNTSKSNALYIGTRQKLANSLTGNEALSINNMNLEIREDCTYLGLIVDNCLTWNNHVDMLCKKLSRRVGVLYRLSLFLPKSCLIHIYYALVQSVIDYGLTIWGHTSNANVMKIQRFQNRSARICTQYFNHDISSATLIHNLRWLNVLERREFLTGVQIYKCMTDQAPNYLSDLFTETRFVHNKNTRNVHNQYLCIPFARTNYYKSSLSVYGPSIWNKIPLNIREAQNVHTFKILLKEWIISRHNM